MKKVVLTGFISELVLSACALSCLVISAVFGQAALIVASALVMLSLLYIAGGFYAEHVKPENSYFNWVVWFWNIFCVEWTWKIFCKQWTWKTFCVEWTWNTFCKAWTWEIFCKAWVWNTFCKAWIWQGFCIGIVYKLFSKSSRVK